jgi:hypothetical protein
MAALSLHCTTLRVAATSGVDCRRFQANRASPAASASCSSLFTSSSSSSSCSVSSLGSRFSTVRYGWGNNGRRLVRAVIEEAVASEQVDVQAPTDNLSMYFKVSPLFLVSIGFLFSSPEFGCSRVESSRLVCSSSVFLVWQICEPLFLVSSQLAAKHLDLVCSRA